MFFLCSSVNDILAKMTVEGLSGIACYVLSNNTGTDIKMNLQSRYVKANMALSNPVGSVSDKECTNYFPNSSFSYCSC